MSLRWPTSWTAGREKAARRCQASRHNHLKARQVGRPHSRRTRHGLLPAPGALLLRTSTKRLAGVAGRTCYAATRSSHCSPFSNGPPLVHIFGNGRFTRERSLVRAQPCPSRVALDDGGRVPAAALVVAGAGVARWWVDELKRAESG